MDMGERLAATVGQLLDLRVDQYGRRFFLGGSAFFVLFGPRSAGKTRESRLANLFDSNMETPREVGSQLIGLGNIRCLARSHRRYLAIPDPPRAFQSLSINRDALRWP